MLEGKFKHKDSKGNEGLLVGGGVQWLTTGKGILHSEMPAMKKKKRRRTAVCGKCWAQLSSPSKLLLES
jgi:redox-sensitive bicupin YhaK (pirin superfamily)